MVVASENSEQHEREQHVSHITNAIKTVCSHIHITFDVCICSSQLCIVNRCDVMYTIQCANPSYCEQFNYSCTQ